jgi:hypothetical protein
MSLPKTGSRPIVVDGVAYRWRIRPRPSTSQGDFGADLTLAVEREGAGGAILVVSVNAPRPDSPMSSPTAPTVVTPADVARYIRAARESGWTPDIPGSPFQLSVPSPGHAPHPSAKLLQFHNEEVERRATLEDLVQQLDRGSGQESRGELVDGDAFFRALLDRLDRDPNSPGGAADLREIE